MGLNRLTFAYRRNVSVKQVSGFVPYVYTLQQQPCMHRVAVYHNQKVLVSRLRVKLKFYVKFCVLRSDSVKYCEVLSLIFSFLCPTTLVLFGNVDFRCSVERDEWKFYPSIKVQNYLLNCSNCNQTRVFLWMKW